MRAIIVDDETPAREYLRILLERTDGVEVVGEAEEAGECLKLVAANRPDVVFLDIRLPGMSGMDLAEIIGMMESAPTIIFVTGYDEYAVQAFDLEAVDYIMKPFSAERLQKTIERLETRSRVDDSDDKAYRGLLKNGKLPIKHEDGWKLVETSEILYAKTEGRKVRVQTEDAVYMSNYTISELEEKLNGFFRANEGCLVNLECVREVVSYGSRSYELLLDDDGETYIPLSRSKAQKLKEMLKLH